MIVALPGLFSYFFLSSAASMTELRQDISCLKADIEKKTGTNLNINRPGQYYWGQ